jgi:hypothetical protein
MASFSMPWTPMIAATSSKLAGTLVVAVKGENGATSIDVYYIDARGQWSGGEETLAASSVAALDH